MTKLDLSQCPAALPPCRAGHGLEKCGRSSCRSAASAVVVGKNDAKHYKTIVAENNLPRRVVRASAFVLSLAQIPRGHGKKNCHRAPRSEPRTFFRRSREKLHLTFIDFLINRINPTVSVWEKMAEIPKNYRARGAPSPTGYHKTRTGGTAVRIVPGWVHVCAVALVMWLCLLFAVVFFTVVFW